MIKQLKRFLQKLSKKISRKNLDKFTDYYISKISNELGGIDSVKVLNVGAGGNIETYLKTKFNFVRIPEGLVIKRLYFKWIVIWLYHLYAPKERMHA